jgi:hypothetical protein
MTLYDPVDCPGCWQGIDAKLAQFPLNGDSSTLGILMFQQASSYLTDQLLSALRQLAWLMVWGS